MHKLEMRKLEMRRNLNWVSVLTTSVLTVTNSMYNSKGVRVKASGGSHYRVFRGTPALDLYA